jgi:DNA polymerase I
MSFKKNPDMTFLVDASLYIFRAYHAQTPDWHDQNGHPTHAAHGFIHTLLNLLEQTGARHVAVCFDEAFGSCFRNRIYPDYKANREPPTEDLLRQFSYCKALTEALGMQALASTEYEADDLIGSLAHQLELAGRPGIMISADKDLAQLHSDLIGQWDFTKGLPFGASAVLEKFGVAPNLMAELQALSGDATDNIPGIKGIGPKTAASLLGYFGSLDAVLARADELLFLRSIRGAATLAPKLKAGAEMARMSLRLTRIARDAPVPELATLALTPVDVTRVHALFDQLGFGGFLRSRVQRWLQTA